MIKIFMKMKKHSYQLFMATALVIGGVVLLFTAFFMPPAAVIDPSVLTAYGETLTFAGALIGLDYKYRASNSNPDDPCAR